MSFLQSDNTCDVVSQSTLEDYQLFFGPTTSTPLITSSTNLGEILFELGLIESKSWARKNGWWKEVEEGFHIVSFSKKKTQIYIFIREKAGEM